MLKHGVTLWLVTRQAIKVHQRDRPFPLRPQHAHHSIKRYHRDGHVRGMRSNTRLRCSQDRQVTVIALTRGAAASRDTFVAWLGDVLEVDAARALQQISA